MKEIDKNLKNELINELNTAYQNVGSDQAVTTDTKRIVGNNGYTLNQEFTLTGKLEVVESRELTTAYLGLETEEGAYLSLQRMMGISSMKGYSATEKAINTTRETRSSEPIEEEVFPEISTEFLFEKCWRPESRDLYDMATLIRQDPEKYKGKKLTYWGTLVRQIRAKKDSKQSNNGWKQGDLRAMIAQMWKMS